MPPNYLLDANLLVLLVVGSLGRDEIPQHERTRGYSASDFDRLLLVLTGASSIILAPNVLTEVSNLLKLGKGFDPKRQKLALLLRGIIETASEQAVASVQAAARAEFLWLGLTDSVLLELSSGDCCLLTSDGHLHSAVLAAGGDAVHFSQLR